MTTATNSNQRRVMIITSDEKIIEQIQTNNSPSSYQTIVLNSDENDNDLSDPLSSDEKQSTPQKKRKHDLLFCVICGSSALGRNFGVVACESCKLFFRRNGLKNPASLFCHRNNDCEIKSETRRCCPACRLHKCLNSGMRRDRLYKAEEKATKRNQIKEKTVEIRNQISRVSLSTLGNINLTQCWPQQGMLSSEDFERVESIRIAYEKRIELAARDGLPWDPSLFATNISQHLNARSISAMRLLAFFKQIPEFNQLNVDDKMILTKYNLMPLIIFNYALSYNLDSQVIIEADNDVPWNSSIPRTIHGEEMYAQLKLLFEPYVHMAKFDEKIIYLSMIVFLLTKGLSTGDGAPEPTLNDDMVVYRAQESYTEFLWKYLEIVYGYEQAFHIITTLVTRFLTWQLVEKQLRHNIAQNLLATGADDLIPLMQSLFHIS